MVRKKSTDADSSSSAKEKLVREYVMKEENKGFSIDQIKKRLLDAGYPESEINAAIRKYNLDAISSKSGKADKPVMARSSGNDMMSPVPRRKINVRLVGGILAALIVIILSLLWILSPSVKDCGSDEDCFVEYANQCTPVKLSQTTEGTIFKYATGVKYQVDSDCKLTKAIDKLDAQEPEEIRMMFEGKSMVCSYTKGDFNSDLVKTITKGLDVCDGPLKTAIYEMIIALYEVAQGT